MNRKAKPEAAKMNMKKRLTLYAVLMTAMMLFPTFLTPAEETRVADITVHISNFSDGRTERKLTFMQPGTDKSSSINIPNGARALAATMNVSGQPYAPEGNDYPENVTVDVGNDGNLEWAFQGKGYGDLGRQNEFVSGGSNTTFTVDVNGTNTTNFHIPAGANILGANCTVKSMGGSGTGPVNIGSGTGGNSWPFNGATNGGAFRFQWLYLASEIGTSGILDKAGWSLNSGTGSATLTNFKMLFCNTPTTSLSTGSFTSNYGVGTPVKVIDNASYIISDSGGYLTIDPPNTFYYDNTKNLIIEVAFTARSGTGYVINTGSGTGNRRAYNNGDGTTDSCTSADTSLYTCRLNFLTKTNLTVDFCADSNMDYVNPGDNWNNTDLSFTQPLANYMATAPVNFTDAYGIGFVTVPIKLSMEFGGTALISNLSVTYEYTAVINESPALGNLAGGMNAALPKIYDGKNSNLMVAVYSGHAGKVRLSNVNIDFIPPVHPAIIETRTPEDTVVVMDENTTAEFCITASDPYDYPMNNSWTVNGKTLLKNTFNFSWYADYEANGTYNVTVSVDNDLQKVATSWQVIVRNVNRKPVIDSFSPEKNYEMDENSSATFEVSASDPDNNPITTAWYADGKRVLSDETTYEYKTTYASAGKHEIKVAVLDSLGGSTTLSWTVTVKEVNAAPEIADSSPAGDAVTMTENSTKKFSIIDQSPDGDKQFIQWSLDGNNTGITARSYNYSADFDAAGSHVLQAEVTDGKLSEKRIWNVVVTDVNRAPRAVISSPAAQAEFLLGSDIVLDGTTSSDPDGDALSMSWSEAGKVLGSGATLTVRLAKGRHLILLGVDDGRKSGTATSQVEIFVRYFDFKAKFATDVLTPTEGKKVIMSVQLTNKGDATIGELPVSFRVDGQEVSSTTIEGIEPDSEFTLEFQWKAVKGDHKLEVSVNNQNFSKTVTVAKKPAAVTGTDSLMPILAIAIIAVIALAAGAVMIAGRRKRAAPPPGPEHRVAQRPQAAVVYTPARQAAPGPSARPPPIPTPTRPPGRAPAIAPHAPAMTEEAKALDAIQNTERMLQEAENVGLDTAKARQSFKIARNFYEMGKYQRAMQYCKTAEDNIE
jgi:hypothetical protein